ncbi:MAG: site-specific integrase [Candidatus Woesearchaeota archaeon]
MDIHRYDKKYEYTLNGLNRAKISSRNKELILKFHNDLILENLSKPRLINYLNKMKLICIRLGKDLDKATIEDLKKVVGSIQQSDYSPWTKQTYKIILRKFYRWFKKPELIDWVKTGFSKSEKKLPSEGDLLTEKEVLKLIKCADHPRDKAFISSLWESGARISELGNLCIKNIIFDKIGTVLTVKGKTGSRKIRLITSTPYLSTWIQNHPHNDGESPLWVNIGSTKHNQVMRYGGMTKMLKDVFIKSGIKKRSNPHIFRHSRATFMAHHLTEFQMNQYFGWIQGSEMPSTYVHMSGKNIDNAILAMNGLSSKESKENPSKPSICPRCDTINPVDSKHCCKCGGILDVKYAMELEEKIIKEQQRRSKADDIMSMLVKDDEVQALLREKIKELEIKEPGKL